MVYLLLYNIDICHSFCSERTEPTPPPTPMTREGGGFCHAALSLIAHLVMWIFRSILDLFDPFRNYQQFKIFIYFSLLPIVVWFLVPGMWLSIHYDNNCFYKFWIYCCGEVGIDFPVKLFIYQDKMENALRHFSIRLHKEQNTQLLDEEWKNSRLSPQISNLLLFYKMF